MNKKNLIGAIAVLCIIAIGIVSIGSCSCQRGKEAHLLTLLQENSLKRKNSVNSIANFSVFIENSGSMDGYVRGNGFKIDLYDLLVKATTISNLPVQKLDLNYINSRPIPYSSNIETFIRNLTPQEFAARGGNRGTSVISDNLKTIVNRLGKNDVSVFVSDCIFASSSINVQKTDLTQTFSQAQQRDSTFSVVVYRLMSPFNGRFYGSPAGTISYIGSRPYFVWMMGNRSILSQIRKAIEYRNNSIQSYQVFNNTDVPYKVVNGARYRLCNKKPCRTTNKHISEINQSNKEFIFNIDADFSYIPVSDNYLCNPANYDLSSLDYTLKITPINNGSNYTHRLTLTNNGPVTPATLQIRLKSQPAAQWEIYNSSTILLPNIPKTAGILQLIDGTDAAFHTSSTSPYYTTLTILVK